MTQLYDVRIQARARDCDGAMDYPEQNYKAVDWKFISGLIGSEALLHDKCSRDFESEFMQGEYAEFNFYSKTDEGFAASQITIWKNDEDRK